MISVLASVRPQWCRLIFSGRKPVEIRKSAPRLPDGENQFRVILYEARGNGGCGAIVGEAVCFFVEKAVPPFNVRLSDLSCVDPDSLREYSHGKPIYGWYLAYVTKYQQPRPLSDYGLQRAPQSWCYIRTAA